MIRKNPDIKAPAAVLATLVRKNYIVNGELTDSGKKLWELLLKIDTEPGIDIKKELKKVKASLNGQFLDWWKAYPAGNAWRDDAEHGGKLYPGSRGFRTKEEDCEKLYLKALADGYTHQEMIGAINYEISEKKRESRATGTNKLTYMVNTHTYLLNRMYINFIEMMKLAPSLGSKPESTGFQTMLV
jgi:hypothetical protein